MKRIILLILPFLFAGVVYAQGMGQEQMPPMEQQGQQVSEHEGIPVLPGARAMREKGSFEVNLPLQDAQDQYKRHLEAQGFNVQEISSDENRARWEVSKGDQKGTVELHKEGDQQTKISIKSESGM